jgi:hypothetical protein
MNLSTNVIVGAVIAAVICSVSLDLKEYIEVRILLGQVHFCFEVGIIR